MVAHSIGRADAIAHLGALDVVYPGIIEAHRAAIDEREKLDLVTQDMLIEQAEQLEQFQWFVRAHLESADGGLSTGGVSALASAVFPIQGCQ
jgi:starvation-inducible DNA-binding protein